MFRWLTRLFMLALFVGGLAVVVLLIVSSLAGTRGVREVPPRRSALLDSVWATAHYRDAYQVPIPRGSFARLDDLRAVAFRKGVEVKARGREVLYRTRQYGLEVHTDYAVVQGNAGPAIRVTTLVRARGDGDLRLALYRPLHRRVTPLLVGRIASSAVADAEEE